MTRAKKMDLGPLATRETHMIYEYYFLSPFKIRAF